MAVSTFSGGGGGSALQPREQIFTESGTWTVPEGVTSAEVLVVGGGGGGYSTTGQSFGGAGGVGTRIVEVTAGDVIPVTIGAGGSNSSALSSGGNSSFGNLVSAIGGKGTANPGSSDQAVFGGVVGVATDSPGHDYSYLTYPIGTATATRSGSVVSTASVAGNYAFISYESNSWHYTYIPDPSIRGMVGYFSSVTDHESNAHVQYDSGYYYFWHNNTNSTGYHFSVPEPANPADLSSQTITTMATLPYANRMFVAALGNLYMPSMAGNSTVYVSSDQGASWSAQTATITGATTTFVSYGYAAKPSWDGEVMIIITQDYTYTSFDGLNWTAHYISGNINGQSSGLVNKIGPRRYMMACHNSSYVYYNDIEFSSDYSSFTRLAGGNFSNVGSNTSSTWSNPGGSPFGVTAYQYYATTSWYVYGVTGGSGYDGNENMYNAVDTSDYRSLSLACVTAYDYATDTYAGLYDNGSVFQGYMAKGIRTIGKVPSFSFSYTGSGNGGIGAGGKGSASKWVSTYERTIYSAGPGLEGYGNGAGGSATPGSGGSNYLGVAAQNGIVIVRWWQ